MEEFHEGDIVELIDNKTMRAKVGSLAKIYQITTKALHVTWLDAPGQIEGGYYKYRFRVKKSPDATMEDTREYLKAVTER